MSDEKILSITVPCYNSSAYMRKCLDSLLAGGDDIEILIVDDGSTDEGKTAAIADDYQRRYPNVCRVIHQENKGHGGAVNTGLYAATGVYFKVVDSDDWVNQDAYNQIMYTLRTLHARGQDIDALIANYVYENVTRNTQYRMHYEKFLPENQVFGWQDIKPLGPASYVLMHSLIYRTKMLTDEVHLQLPEHTFYVDNIYAMEPFAKVQKMFYLNVDFYRYFIGRPDQSVNVEVMVKRADQQYAVNKTMIDFMAAQKDLQPEQEKFMAHYLTIIMTITTVLYIQAGQPEKMQSLWQEMQDLNPDLYNEIRYSLIGRSIHLPGRLGQQLILRAYKITQRAVGFQ